VQYVSNITDIDDKIIEAAKQSGEEINAITDRYAQIYNADMSALGAEKPDFSTACDRLRTANARNDPQTDRIRPCVHR